MPAARIAAIALAGEGALALVALVWASARGIPLEPGPWREGVALGLAAAAGLAAVNYALLHVAPDVWPVTAVRRLYREMLRPLFARVGLPAILAISAAAGIAEELFFRGVLQREWGIGLASVAFGAAHTGSFRLVGFGAWATLIGAFLGWLCQISGGLVAPMVAHAVYDALALAYVRWAPDRDREAVGAPQEENRS